MAWCQVEAILDATFVSARLGSWVLALIVGMALAIRNGARNGGRRGILSAAGFAVMTVPAWWIVIVTMPDILRTVCAQGNLNLVIVPGQTLLPTRTYDLSGQYISTILSQLGYITLGALLVARGRDAQSWKAPSFSRIARSLQGLIPMGRGETWSVTWGLALFPLLIAANVALLWFTNNSSIQTGDDSQVFANISTWQVILLSLAAGFGEELTYRGVMQQGLKRLMPRSWMESNNRATRWLPSPGLVLAIALQAVVFAYAHAGYANLQHLLFAFLFALAASAVTEILGIWAAIVLHVLVDFVAFAASEIEAIAHSGAQPPLLLIALGTLVAAATLMALAYKVGAGIRWLRQRPA